MENHGVYEIHLTLKLSTLIEIDLETSESKVCACILYIYFFYGFHIVFEYLLIHYDRFREPMIDFHSPYTIQGIGTK